jgi:hypothetical protein
MNTNRIQRLFIASVCAVGLFALGQVAVAAGKANHHNGKNLLGDKVKADGHHVLETKGAYTVSAEVKSGKIAGVHVKHAKNGDVAVKKYKTDKKMAQLLESQGRFHLAAYAPQDQYIGTTYIGYSFIDEYGDEEIYWFPYDMILDGDTGAIAYVPAG